jgi:AbrB family looped-hinge helix DNA binding protein
MKKRATVGPKGQVTIPKELREKYHLHEGEEVIISSGQEGVVLKHPPSTLRGFLKGKLDLESFEDELRRLRKEWRL